MEIKGYDELTEFISTELVKMQEDFGIQKSSDTLIKFREKRLQNYVNLYDKPLLRREKRKVQLEEAIDTMPHGFWWKFFHTSLWKRIKYLEGQKQCEKDDNAESSNSTSSQVFYPEIQRKTSLPSVVDDRDNLPQV